MKSINSRKWAIVAGLVGATAVATPLIGYAMGGGSSGGMMGGLGHGMMGGFRGGMNDGYGPAPGRGSEQDRRQGPSTLVRGAGRTFAQTCAQCHPLPDPRQHTAEQWPGVVARMEQHMRERNLRVPSDRAIGSIEAFLQRETQGRR